MKRMTMFRKYPGGRAMSSPPDQQPLFERIFAAVGTIPEGKVSTYGRIAQYIGCSAQMVGFAMAAVPEDSDVPCHRVINYKGMISRRSDGYSDGMQRALLETEGIRFDETGHVDLKRNGWLFTRLPCTTDDI
jgi:methylated-DNA-protein-cysteine methyltransferase-like protein